MTVKSLAVLVGGLGVLAGCSNYYQVRDPQSGSVYYTRGIADREGGAISFEDELTDRDVTLQQSEVARIDGDLYDARTAEVDIDDLDGDIYDDDLEVHVDARPAAARTMPEPDRQIEIPRDHVDLDYDDVDVYHHGEDVRIDVDH